MRRPAPPSPRTRAPAAAKAQFRLETHVFYLISRVLASRNRVLNARLAEHDLDYPRWRVLGVLSQHPGASMLQLAELTSVDRTSLTHTVRLMVRERLIHRTERGTDRRSVELALTPQGRRAFDRILPIVLALNAQALAGLKPAEVASLRRALARVLDNLTT